MHTTVAQNIAHRTDLIWTKSKGKSFKVGCENYISEYTTIDGTSIRKGWRMTGADWYTFNAADEIIGRAHSLTWAKYEAAGI